MDTTATTDDELEAQVGALAERLFLAGVGAFELVTIHLGRRLGLYEAVADGGAITADDLAQRAGIHPRYAREWLEQQAVAGLLTVDDTVADAADRRYSLPPASVEVLANPDSLAYVAPLSGFVAALGQVLPALADAYSAGSGIEFGGFGDDVRDNQAAFNRPAFLQQLGQEWLPAGAPDLHERLLDRPARLLDVGCGYGWSSIALALAYPQVTVLGLDLDDVSIQRARRNAKECGVDDRVRFEVRNASDPQLADTFDAAFLFEALHDMPHPVEVLRAVRAAVVDGAPVIVMDERTADQFTAPGDEVERFLYAASVLHCLPVGMADEGSAGTGTVMRTDTLRRYAADAGFARATVLPIEHDFFRFYRLES